MKAAVLFLLLLVPPAAFATTYYVANNGSDANSGTSAAHPWATIAQLNRGLLLAAPGDAFLLRRGDVFRDDYIRCVNLVSANSGTTLASAPPKCSGNSANPVTIGSYGTGADPLIDGADPLGQPRWASVGNSTYATALSFTPWKLYLDSPGQEQPQLLPVPNASGAYVAANSYTFLSLATYNGNSYICGRPAGCKPQSMGSADFWCNISNSGPGNYTQSFSPTNSGIQNVRAIPGSFWYDSRLQMLYVHLADGSNPASHTLEVTRRPYGVYLQSTNYVTVQGLDVERVGYDAFAAVAFSDSSRGYTTNEYIHFIDDRAWNYGSIVRDTYSSQTYQNRAATFVAGFVFLPSGENPTHVQQLMRGELVQGSYAGTMDSYFALRASRFYISGISMGNVTGGQILNNTGHVVNAACMEYGPYPGALKNDGPGEVAGNTCTNSQGNFYYGGAVNGRVHHNIAHDSYGEGIQLGGNLANMGSPEIDHNTLYNLGRSADTSLYNGIDCNSLQSFSPYVHHNTIVNVYAASITMEGACDHMKADSNILSQNGYLPILPNAALATTLNHSNLVYISPSVAAVHAWTWSHNLYQLGSNNVLATFQQTTCSTLNGHIDPTGFCANPMFVNPPTGNFRLQPNSPAASGGTVLGALPVQ